MSTYPSSISVETKIFEIRISDALLATEVIELYPIVQVLGMGQILSHFVMFLSEMVEKCDRAFLEI